MPPGCLGREEETTVRRATLILVVIALAGCAGPEPGDTGYVVLDEEARAAGLAVDTGDGRAPHSSALPIPVSAHDDVAIVAHGMRAPLIVAPGETVEVKDARGTLVRGTARADRLVITGGHANAVALAQMLGATLVDRPDGRIELAGDDVLLAAALYGDAEGITAASVLLSGTSTEGAAPWVLGDTTPERAAAMPVSEDRIGAPVADVAVPASIDPASLVGLYEAQGVTLLVDAAGGYSLSGVGVAQHGRWSVSGGRLVLLADGTTGGVAIGVGADADELREDSGVVLRSAHPPVRDRFLGFTGGAE